MGMLILWTLIGTWHGAGFHYIFSVGLLQFLYIFLGELCDSLFVRIKKLLHINDKKLYWHIFQSIRTTALMMFAWVFFNAKSFVDALNMLIRMIAFPRLKSLSVLFDSDVINGNKIRVLIFVILSGIMVFVVDLLHENGKSVRTIIGRRKYPIRLAFYLVLAFTIIIFGAYGSRYVASDFIYIAF